MTRDDIIKLHDALCSKGREIIKKKNHDYCGGEKVDPFSNFRSCQQMEICTPEQGILVRLSDKFRRLITGCTVNELKVTDESFEDTTIDLINYAVLLFALRQENQKTREEKIAGTETNVLSIHPHSKTALSWTCPVNAPKHSIFVWDPDGSLIFLTSDATSIKLPEKNCQSVEDLKIGDCVCLDSTGKYLRKGVQLI